MTRTEFRGARAANAGDDYHELWALRELLALLKPDTALVAVTVEGVHPEDETESASDTWDGVDCAYYFGGHTIATASEVRIDQVKYSSANPGKLWTVARLTAASRHGGAPRSVLSRLGDAFEAIRARRPDLIAAGKVTMRLVSNQPASPEIMQAISVLRADSSALGRAAAPTGAARGGTSLNAKRDRGRRSTPSSLDAGSKLATRVSALAKASHVHPNHRVAFFRALDFSQCGAGSRLAVEGSLIRDISKWAGTDVGLLLDDLRRRVRRLMMPESKDEVITRSDVLAWLGFSDEAALFPCPSELAPPHHLVPRAAVDAVVDALTGGHQRVCLHGGGGVGKTTALFEVAARLPSGSAMVTYDCYGGGRYLDAESPRHRPADAFLQLANELAAHMRLPLLVTERATISVFAKRLGLAAAALSTARPDALLVISVDAADNAVYASQRAAPPERAFVQELAQLGTLPVNVRLLITARSSRVEELELRRDFLRVELPPFTEAETATNVRARWSGAPDSWIEDFHALSQGNPRVQVYAFGIAVNSTDFEADAQSRAQRALAALQPKGKDLDAVFAGQFEEAIRKSGSQLDATEIAAALVGLPRPIPISHLAAVVHRTQAQVREFCEDLAPGIRFEGDAVGFTDEDFEAFVRAEAGSAGVFLERAGDQLSATRSFDAYAATHVASVLFAAGRRADVISLVRNDDPLDAIKDPVARRDVQLHRLRLAMRVCREAGNLADALFTVVQGAAALKSDDTIRDTFVQFPDLAARFAAPTVGRVVLQRSSEAPRHGRLLFHLASADAEGGDKRSVREDRRRIGAWLRERTVAFGRAEEEQDHAQMWPIEDMDIAAGVEAVLRTEGPAAALAVLAGWRPRTLGLRVALTLGPRLAVKGEVALIQQCLDELDLAPWDLLLRVPLALSGSPFDVQRADESLAMILRRGWVGRGTSSLNTQEREWQNALQDTILTACELAVAAGHRSVVVDAVLTAFAAPGSPPLYVGDTATLDWRLRAHALLARRADQPLNVDQWLPERATLSTLHSENPISDGVDESGSGAATGPRGPNSAELREKRRRAQADDERDRELRDFAGPLVPIYDARARILLGQIDPTDQTTVLRRAVDAAERDAYRMRHHTATSMRARAAESLLVLLARTDVEPATMWSYAVAIAAPYPSGFSNDEAQLWLRAGARPELHAVLVENASTRAVEIRGAQIAAPEQVTALSTLARAVLPVSAPDAKAIYFDALAAVEDVDPDFVRLVTLEATLVGWGARALDSASKRRMAAEYSIVLEDSATRLRGYDGFPWSQAARGLAELDIPFAFAAAARWDDTGLVPLADTLPAVLQVALEADSLSPEAVVAIHPVVGFMPEGIPAAIAERFNIGAAAETAAGVERRLAIAELLAETVIRYETNDGGVPTNVRQAVKALLAGASGGPWCERLHEIAATRPTLRAQSVSRDRAQEPTQLDDSPDDAMPTMASSALATSRRSATLVRDAVDSVAHLPWPEHDVTTATGLARALKEFTHTAPGESWIPVDNLLRSARDRVAVSARTSYLTALVALLNNDNVPSYAIADEILDALNAWWASAAVRHWCATTLVDGLTDALPALGELDLFSRRTFAALCRYASTEPGHLGQDRRARDPREQASIGNQPGVALGPQAARVRDALLLGLERHVDQLSPGAIYSVVERVARLAAPPDTASAATAILTWCANRVAPEHRSRWNVEDLTGRPENGMGRLLYALLGDFDVRTRWRAAHAIRRLAASGEHAIVSAVVEQYARLDDALFRDPEAPFYWQAARLWLVMTLTRIAHASAPDAAQYCDFLVAAGTDPDFPHLLLRAFARDGVAALSGAGVVGPRSVDMTALDAALGVGHRRQRRPNGMRFSRNDHRADEDERRFHFDSTDTLPYWYRHAVDVFVDVDMPEFLDAAEHWITDAWKVTTPVWEWGRDPRTDRLGEYTDWLHRHGSRPRKWRFSTHLEWHAMWCAIGTLLPNHTLVAAVRGDDYDTLEGLLRREALRDPPYWLADFRTPRPLAAWLSPEDGNSVDVEAAIPEAGFRAHAGVSPVGSWVTVAGAYETSGPSLHLATTIQTALVSPARATALIRALQTVDDSYNFRLPDAGDEFEIRTPRRKLLGWLRRAESDAGIDDDDPLRRGAAGLAVTLPQDIAAQLGVRFVLDPFPCWVDNTTGNPVLKYESWSNSEASERTRSYGITVRGWRLQIAPDALQRFLFTRGLDLALEVGIHQRSKGYEYERYDEEDATRDARFSRIYLLRADGELDTAEGSAGTWQALGA